jgi:hypothetical protein
MGKEERNDGMTKKTISILIITAIIAAAGVVRAQDSAVHKGKVTATMDSGGYTYVEFEENGKKAWAASAPFKVAMGDMIEFSGALPMQNFTSKSLNKTFAVIYFAGSIAKVGAGTGAAGSGAAAAGGVNLPAGQAQIPIKGVPAKTAPVTIKAGSVVKADGGYTVAECYAQKKALNGKSIKVRGRVVKFSPEIMGKNWLHLQDGTGNPVNLVGATRSSRTAGEGTNDLTVTTTQTAAVGDLVMVTGTIAADKDFGSGYAYSVIVEGATVKVEEKAAKPPAIKAP